MNTVKSLAADARVLVIHVARIGDTLLVTPALRALKTAVPSGHLTVLAHPKRRELLEGLSFINELGSITAKTAWWRGHIGKRWDVAVVYGHDAPLIRYAARVASRVVAFRQKEHDVDRLLWQSVTPPPALIHAVNERLMLPAALGVQTDDFRLAYAPSDAERSTAKMWLNRYAADASPLIGFQVASFATKSYRDWPVPNFAELGRRLLATHPNARILVFGDKASRAHAETLANQLGPRVLPIAGSFALRATAALMAHLDLYVGVDTGPTHLAGALRVPMVALYHCRHRGRYLAPLQHNELRVLEHPASDIECSDSRSMAEISVDQVWNAIQSVRSTKNDRT